MCPRRTWHDPFRHCALSLMLGTAHSPLLLDTAHSPLLLDTVHCHYCLTLRTPHYCLTMCTVHWCLTLGAVHYCLTPYSTYRRAARYLYWLLLSSPYLARAAGAKPRSSRDCMTWAQARSIRSGRCVYEEWYLSGAGLIALQVGGGQRRPAGGRTGTEALPRQEAVAAPGKPSALLSSASHMTLPGTSRSEC